VLDAADQRDAERAQVRRLAGHLDVGKAGEQLAEDHRELPPGQVCAQAELGTRSAEAEVRIRIAEDVEAFRLGEDARVAVGGAVEEDEPISLAEVVTRQGQVACDRAAHERDRGRGSHDLFDRAGCHPGEILLPESALVRVLVQQLHAQADGGPGCVVAGHRQEDEERGELLRGEHVLTEVVVHERGREVVRRMGAPVLCQLVHEGGQLHAGLEQGSEHVLATAEPVCVARPEDDVGRLQHGGELAARDAHHVADHEQRKRLRDGFDQVDLTLLAHSVDELGADLLHRVEQLLQLARRERPGDDPPLPRVARVVHHDE
jgi:hypothetical protein